MPRAGTRQTRTGINVKLRHKGSFDHSKLAKFDKYRKQIAALCWRYHHGDLEVLLITSRDTGRWVIPKGWPMKGKQDYEAAAQEAWEEAGVTGRAKKKPIGVFTYKKGVKSSRDLDCSVTIFPLKVDKLASRFPEKGQRRRKWMSPKKAANKVREPMLKQLLTSLKVKAD